MAQQHQRVAAQARSGQASGRQPPQRGLAVCGVHHQRPRGFGATGQGVDQFLQWQADGAQHRGHGGGRLAVAQGHFAGQQQVAAVDLGAQASEVDEAHAVGAQALAVVLQGAAQVGAVAVFQQRDLKAARPERSGHRGGVAARGLEHDAVAHGAHAHYQGQPLAWGWWVGSRGQTLAQGQGLPTQAQHQPKPQPQGRCPAGPARTHRQEIPLQTAAGHLSIECSQPTRIL